MLDRILSIDNFDDNKNSLSIINNMILESVRMIMSTDSPSFHIRNLCSVPFSIFQLSEFSQAESLYA